MAVPLLPHERPLPIYTVDTFESSTSTDASTSAHPESICTTTSGATILGIGSLSGRAIRAVGKMTLRGVEEIVLLRKLAHLRTLFSHEGSSPSHEAYDDLLEMSRLNYPCQLLLAANQIAAGLGFIGSV